MISNCMSIVVLYLQYHCVISIARASGFLYYCPQPSYLTSPQFTALLTTSQHLYPLDIVHSLLFSRTLQKKVIRTVFWYFPFLSDSLP